MYGTDCVEDDGPYQRDQNLEPNVLFSSELTVIMGHWHMSNKLHWQMSKTEEKTHTPPGGTRQALLRWLLQTEPA